MDAVQFFDVIMPSAGQRCLAIPWKGKSFYHVWGADNAWLATASQRIDQRHQKDIYFAVATFKDQSSREQTNVEAVRSFWVDLDVGPTKPYRSARDAAAAILAFAAKLGLARPFLVASGVGVHCYWPMAVDMDGPTWTATAAILKAALTVEGVGQDPSRTSDRSTVLRPPGTHHRKREPKLVRVALEGAVMQLVDFQTALLPYAGSVRQQSARSDFSLPEGGPAGDTLFDNDALGGGLERPTSDPELVADQCAIIGMVRDTRGNVDQPTWYQSLAVIAKTTGGRALAHEWSSGHPQYSYAETEKKLDQHEAKHGGATTCVAVGGQHPTICAACPHAGKVKTPWALGMQRPTTVTVEEKVKTPSGWTIKTVTITTPEGFKVVSKGGKNMLAHSVPNLDEEGKQRSGADAWIHDVFCETLVIPITRLWIEGVAYVECEMDLKDGDKRRFLLEGGMIGKGKDTLAAELARNEIVCKNGKAHVMDSYMKAWMTRLKDTAEQVVAHHHFGWDDRDFVLGDSVLGADGGETRAVLVGMAKSKMEAVSTKGDLQTWVDVIDRAYNAPGQEAFQFLVACSFAAPLMSMLQHVNGVTVYAHTEGSGAGKTTAQKAGLSAWGDADDLMLADNKVTTNALWGLMGAYSSLPIVFDELTNQKNDIASELVFSVSSGRSKQRMNASGELRMNNANWCTILMASGNNLLSEKLALHRANAQAEISRLFEFTLSATPHLTPNQANALFPKLRDNYGHAGHTFARYVVDHYDEVSALLRTTQEKLNTRLDITQVERFWSALLACALVALSLCRNLGLLRFEVKPLTTWLFARLDENRVQRDAATSDSLELLGNMLADLWPGVLVTNGEGDLRTGKVATVVQAPRGQLTGRAIIPLSSTEVPVLLLNVQSVRDWTNKKGVSAREMFASAIAAGWADPLEHRVSLGRGTVEYSATSSYIRTWKLFPVRMGAAAGTAVAQKLGLVTSAGTAASGAGP